VASLFNLISVALFAIDKLNTQNMYYVFQQRDEVSSVLFYESCETEQELDDLIATAAYPVMFIYDNVSKAIRMLNDYYDLQQCHQIINSLIK
jgi:hypothetical protein